MRRLIIVLACFVLLPVPAHVQQKESYDYWRFQREMIAMAQFQHPHVVRIFDAGETESGRVYMVMEFVEGAALSMRRVPSRFYCSACDQTVRNISHSFLRPTSRADFRKPEFSRSVRFGSQNILSNAESLDMGRSCAGVDHASR